MLGQHVRHALARAVAPQRDHGALAGGLQRVHVFGHRLEHVLVGLAALGGEIVAGARGDLDRVGGFGRRERRQPRQRDILQALAPFGFGEIEPVRRQRLVGRPGPGLIERVFARLIIIRDLREALVGGFLGERLQKIGVAARPLSPEGRGLG